MRFKILYVSHMPASPPRFGAQARVDGLMRELAKRHDVTAVALVDGEYDLEESRQAMQGYCRDLVLIPIGANTKGMGKRLHQLRSLGSPMSFERMRLTVPALQQALDKRLRGGRFDIVNLEFTFLGHCNLRQAAAGVPIPALVVDSHNIDYDLARQLARGSTSLSRRLYYEANWRKLRREELATYAAADGVYLCSAADERRLLDRVPSACTAVIPNAADVAYYQPRMGDPKPDGRTLVFFGLLSYAPNVDGVLYFCQSIWPRIAKAHPGARLKLIGGGAPPELRALAGPRIELTGFVPDLRPHLAEAAAVVVPLRLGGGTRLKIVEAMAMGKAIVSTCLGAEGIDAVADRDIMIEHDAGGFADAAGRLLSDPALAARMGQSARRLAQERYSWSGAGRALEAFYGRVLQQRS